MKIKNLFFKGTAILLLCQHLNGFAQAPVANFSISPNPVCSGASNLVQITDLSSNAPTAWAYTVTAGGPNSMTSAVQNPTFSFNAAGIYNITLVASNASGASAAVSQTFAVLPSPNAQITPQNQTSCPGGNALNINVTTGGPGGASLSYSWSSGATSSSISVSPSVTTVYTCIITSTNGCSSARTATVTIAQPSVTIASNPVNICPGSSSTITATGTAPGPFTYSWSTGATTRTISTSSPGVYSVTVTNANGCTTSQSYSISSSTTLALTATSNPSVLCAGNTAMLHVTGGTSYTWSSGATTPNTTVNPVSSTVYTVSGLSGSCTGVTSITLNVASTPTLTVSASPSTICQGHSSTLTAGGATTYTWEPSTASQSIAVSPSVNTTYTVRGNNPGCPNRTATVSLNVSPTPDLSISSSGSVICAGEVVALAANGAATYTWNGGSTVAILLVTPSITTTYTVTGSNSSNCSATANFTQKVSACTAISKQEVNTLNIELFPNPNNGHFVMRSAADTDIQIMNISGQIVNESHLSAQTETNIDISEFSPGIYFVTSQTNKGFVKQKFIVLK